MTYEDSIAERRPFVRKESVEETQRTCENAPRRLDCPVQIRPNQAAPELVILPSSSLHRVDQRVFVLKRQRDKSAIALLASLATLKQSAIHRL